MKTSKIGLDFGQLSFFFVYSVVLMGLGVFLLALTTWGQFIGGLLCLIGVVVLLGKALQGAGRGPCPECGHSIGDLQRKGSNPSLLCPACGAFSEGDHGTLRPIEASRIASSPLFAARLPQSPIWPEGCVLCRAKVDQEVEVKLVQVDLLKTLGKGLIVSAIAGTVGNQGLALSANEARLKVPHCKDHSDGAKLQSSVDKKGIDIVFRSLAYQREFCELNKTTSAPLAHYTKSQGPLAGFVPK